MAARRLADTYGSDSLTLLFADTLMEDADLYRFLDEAAADIDAPLIKIADGRTPWEVFSDEKYLGNSRVDPCSKILKRNLLRQWVNEHCQPKTHTIALGIDWSEEHRLKNAAPRWLPFKVIAPLCDEPVMDRANALATLSQKNIEPPRLYALGFPHNNCGGFCIKAGQAQFALLLETMPERYAYHEAQEEALRDQLGKPVTILRKQVKNVRLPLSLRDFRLSLEAQEPHDSDEWGGCGCAIE